MKFTFQRLAATTLLAAVCGMAAAQPAPQPGQVAPAPMQRGPGGSGGEAGRMHDGMLGPQGMHDGRREGMHQGMREQFMARRLAHLKETLRITPAQEGAWTAYTAALRPAPRQRPDLGEMARLSTPERIDRMRALRSQRMAEMDRRGEATKSFYAGLSAEQKRVFDQITLRGEGHEGHHHGGHHRG